ncbi:DUF2867 domain-containing protein [Vibrio viridaestus]|uniref:DUF2867 domain-containing protein n=2 Tax=Vibrio viridaestus TaxID=2487322 RepID=A0A3N9TEK5_9VIBR|nr:DUF2867 domain-containing protein [Vibrio viridaestus]
MPMSCGLESEKRYGHYVDSFEVVVSRELSAKLVYYAIFAYLPKSIQLALVVRNKLVSLFGFRPSLTVLSVPVEDLSAGTQCGDLIFYRVDDDEVICATNERHLDIWLSVQRVGNQMYAVTTLVNTHSWLGRLYLMVIRPLHKLVARQAILSALNHQRL